MLNSVYDLFGLPDGQKQNYQKPCLSSSPRNYHRRHDSSVTLNKFDDKLFAGFLSVQKLVREKFSPDKIGVEKSKRYAQELYEQFGLNSRKYPNVYDNTDLMGLIK